ncbi:MAG: hypothetical protein N2557_08020 [Hydrogenophilus sp.]|nr:hypothetical protein [Hydrogenophilus sp.]
MSILATDTKVQIVRLTKALFDAAPGATYLTQFESAAKTNGINAVAAELMKYAAATTPDAAANKVVTNLGLTGAAKDAAVNYLKAHFTNAKDALTMGKVLVESLDQFATLVNDSTYGAAAQEFNKQILSGYTFSINSANTTTDMTALKAALNATVAPVSGVQGASTHNLTLNNDTVNVTLTTIGAGDAYLDPNPNDNDRINVSTTSWATQPLNGVRMENIETFAIDATGFNNVNNAVVFDFAAPQSHIQGVRTIIVSGNAVGGDVVLTNVRDSVTTIDASGLLNSTLQLQGFVPNIGGVDTSTGRTIIGSRGNDLIVGSQGADTVRAGDGNDIINVTQGGNDNVQGQGGNDIILFGGTGSATLSGGDGADTIVIAPNATTAALTGVNIVAPATGGTLTVNGDADNDTVIVTAASTADFATLAGGAGGADTLIVEVGAVGQMTPTGFETIILALTPNSAGAVNIPTLISGGSIAGNTVIRFQNGIAPGSVATYTANPAAGTLIANGQLIRLTDLAGGQDLSTSAGMTAALAAGGEYANLDMAPNTAAAAATISGNRLSLFLLQSDGTANITATLIAQITGVNLIDPALLVQVV